MVTKICSKCKQEKNLDDFHIRLSRKDRRQSWCKVCLLEAEKQRRRASPEKHRQSNRQQRAKRRLEALQYYSGGVPKCASCGETDPLVLCVDHINNKGFEHRRILKYPGGSEFYSWLRRERYPSGYKVLCYNCNIRKWRQYLNDITEP